jgi:UDP-2,3-diacylglucosamine pyrophosphatase LpxH
MRLQILSDLHLESQPEFRASRAPGADVLVLAGDIGSYQPGSRLPLRDRRDFGLAQFAAASHGGKWPLVLFVPGNHEYDGSDFDALHAELRAAADAFGITWLDRSALVHRGVRFVGTTLWSDFDALAMDEADPARRQKKREKAFRAANFYLQKAQTTRHGRPFLAQEIREEALACQRWLAQALQEPFAGPTVVVTHFAPSLRSADPRYGRVPGTAGFCNALDPLLHQADWWIHGHLHCANHYVAESPTGRPCRVVSNPLGYAAKGEQNAFLPHCVLEVPSARVVPA